MRISAFRLESVLLPAALPLALWGSHFLRGHISADELIDHCGVQAPILLAPLRGQVDQINMGVLAPGDLSGITSSEVNNAILVGSVALLPDSFLTPPDWQRFSCQATPRPSRAEAERLFQEVMRAAYAHFKENPVFGANPPHIEEIAFPIEHPPRARELIVRAATTSAIAQALSTSWTADREASSQNQKIVQELLYASRRGFEAGVVL